MRRSPYLRLRHPRPASAADQKQQRRNRPRLTTLCVGLAREQIL